MPIISFILYMLATICFYIFLYHLVLCFGRKSVRLNVLFSVLCLMHVLYFPARGQWYSQDTIELAFACVQYSYGAMSLIMIMQFWFFYYFTEKSYPKLINILGTILLGIYSILSLIPGHFTISIESAYEKTFGVFNLTEFTSYEFTAGILFKLFLFFVFAEMLFILVIILRYYRKRFKTVLKPIPIAFSILLLAAFHDIFAAEGLSNSFYLSEFAYMTLILAITYRLTGNFIETMNEAERSNVSLDAIVKKRTLELEEKNKKLKILSTTDQLTGLFNRRSIEETMKNNILQRERYKTPFSVILMGIDHFKSINSTYGYDFGDQVLVSIAKNLSECIRNTDMAGRWGGKDFLILAPQTNLVLCKTQADRLQNYIQESTHATINHITASFGIAQFSSGDSIQSLIKRAYKGLYEAKKKGRNRVEAC